MWGLEVVYAFACWLHSDCFHLCRKQSTFGGCSVSVAIHSPSVVSTLSPTVYYHCGCYVCTHCCALQPYVLNFVYIAKDMHWCCGPLLLCFFFFSSFFHLSSLQFCPWKNVVKVYPPHNLVFTYPSCRYGVLPVHECLVFLHVLLIAPIKLHRYHWYPIHFSM